MAKSNVRVKTTAKTKAKAKAPQNAGESTPKTTGPDRHEGAPSARERAGDACLRAAAALSSLMGIAHPATAYAAIDVSSTLTNVLNLLSNGIVLLGGILIVMGLVNLGMSLRDGGRGGAELSGALGMIVGGIVVSSAGAYFRTLDTNIAG